MRLSSDFPIHCPGCGKCYYVAETMTGADVTCGACGSDFSIPSSNSPPNSPPATSTSAAPAVPVSADQAPAMAPAEENPTTAQDFSIPAPAAGAAPVVTTAPARTRWMAPALLVLGGAAAVLAGAEWLGNRNRLGETAPAPAPKAAPPVAAATGSPAPLPGRFPEKNPLPTPTKTGVPHQVDTMAAEPEAPLDTKRELPTAPAAAEAIQSATAPALPDAPEAIASVDPAPEPAAPDPPDPALVRLDPRQALDHFLAAASMERRLALSQHPEKIRAAMQARHQNEPPKAFAAVMVDLLTTGKVPGTQRSFHLYNVYLENRDVPIPVAVEKTADGYRVDWQTFIECHDESLKKFFAAPSTEPSRFRVSLRRTHYFGPPVPGQDRERIAFKVEAPTRDESFYVWADKSSRVFKDQLSADGRDEWDAESYVIAELRWRGDSRQGRWVALEKIASDSWRPD